MSSRHWLIRIGVFAVAAFLLIPLLAAAATLQVSSSSSLADIMAGASPGDVLVLECGLYQEEGILVTPGVTVRSETGQPGGVILETPGQQPVLIFQDAGPDTRLEGLIFRLSDADTSGAISQGGAVLCAASSPIIQRCEFRDLAAAYGGAVFCDSGSSPLFQDCVFQDNQAYAVGGAIACVSASSPMLAGCLLVGNSAGSTGGAINAAAGSSPTLLSCTLVGNDGDVGSGLAGWDAAAGSLFKVILVDGLVGGSWCGDSQSVPTISYSDLFGNAGGDWEGALAVLDGAVGNLSADPSFCSPTTYTINENGPCSPTNSGCGLIGAFPVACAFAISVPDDELPVATRFTGSYPNPFNPRTTIRFDLARPGSVSLAVYDVAGRLVRQLIDEPMTRGSHEVTWQGNDRGDRTAAAGVYFLRLKANDTVSARRVTLIK